MIEARRKARARDSLSEAPRTLPRRTSDIDRSTVPSGGSARRIVLANGKIRRGSGG
ncbi:hypothetical protein KCP69_06090 [Salmonella enterica subsp. enterica]|nr:hypothetical protein KCP69_06090 [Salmonella enterica subsp. enterica]